MENAKIAPNIYTYRPLIEPIDREAQQHLGSILITDASKISLKNSKKSVFRRANYPEEKQ